MKLEIKTLNQKSLFIDIEDTQTVYDLKKELTMYADVGVRPELQKLIYAGKILANEDKLSVYNIDVKKFLVIVVMKQPAAETPSTSKETTVPKAATEAPQTESIANTSSEDNEEFKLPEQPVGQSANTSASTSANISINTSGNTSANTSANTSVNTSVNTSANTSISVDDSLVEAIVNMGYVEDQVRSALEASFNNPERAIEYLIDGIPTSSSGQNETSYSVTDDDLTMSPFEVFRTDPLFQDLRRYLRQNLEYPNMVFDAIQQVGESNPALLSLINDNQSEFLTMLLEDSDDDEYDDDGDVEFDNA